MNKVCYSTYIVELFHVCHGKLGHANYRSLQRMVTLGPFPKFDINKNHKCEICVDVKFSKK